MSKTMHCNSDDNGIPGHDPAHCCWSCHEDQDEGYADMMLQEIVISGSKYVVEYCCAAADEVSDLGTNSNDL